MPPKDLGGARGTLFAFLGVPHAPCAFLVPNQCVVRELHYRAHTPRGPHTLHWSRSPCRRTLIDTSRLHRCVVRALVHAHAHACALHVRVWLKGGWSWDASTKTLRSENGKLWTRTIQNHAPFVRTTAAARAKQPCGVVCTVRMLSSHF